MLSFAIFFKDVETFLVFCFISYFTSTKALYLPITKVSIFCYHLLVWRQTDKIFFNCFCIFLLLSVSYLGTFAQSNVKQLRRSSSNILKQTKFLLLLCHYFLQLASKT